MPSTRRRSCLICFPIPSGSPARLMAAIAIPAIIVVLILAGISMRKVPTIESVLDQIAADLGIPTVKSASTAQPGLICPSCHQLVKPGSKNLCMNCMGKVCGLCGTLTPGVDPEICRGCGRAF
jgi:hypothetical protein